jgi:O-antigen/teichoic acid export membrane protein
MKEHVKAAGIGAIGRFFSFSLSKVLSLIFYACLMHYFVPKEVGIYFLALAVSGSFNLIISNWVNEIFPVFIPKKENNKEEFALLVRWIIVTFTILLLFLLILYFTQILSIIHPTLTKMKSILIILIIASTIANCSLSYLNAKRKFIEISVIIFISSFTKLIVFLAFIFLIHKTDVLTIITAHTSFFISQMFLTSAILFKTIKFEFPTTEQILNVKDLINEGIFGVKSVFAKMGSLILGWVDILILTYLTNLDVVGAYGTLRIMANTVAGAGASAISSVMLPTLALFYKDKSDEKKKKKILYYSAKWCVESAMLLSIGMLTITPYLFNHFFKKYSPYLYLLPIFLLASLVRALAVIIRMDYRAKGKIDVIFRWTLIENIINVILDVCLVPLLKGFGSAFATFISTIFAEINIIKKAGHKLFFYTFTFRKLPTIIFVMVFIVMLYCSIIARMVLLSLICGIVGLAILGVAIFIVMDQVEILFALSMLRTILPSKTLGEKLLHMLQMARKKR